MRVQKYIAHCGITSRRKAEGLISNGRVKINDKIVVELGVKIDPDRDDIKLDDEIIKLEKNNIYIMLNKPLGYVTTMKDEKNRKIVLDLVKGIKERIYPVGRLDKDTTGLLILTNDGNLTNKLTHPSNEVIKRYIAEVEGVPNESELERFKKGINIDDQITSEASIEILKKDNSKSVLNISIHEGRNRQVKKMCEAINHPVKNLKRVEVGGIKLDDLNVGEWRYLEKHEVDYLKKI